MSVGWVREAQPPTPTQPPNLPALYQVTPWTVVMDDWYW